MCDCLEAASRQQSQSPGGFQKTAGLALKEKERKSCRTVTSSEVRYLAEPTQVHGHVVETQICMVLRVWKTFSLLLNSLYAQIYFIC